MTVKLVKRVFSSQYGVGILTILTLDINEQDYYAQLNHDITIAGL